MRMGSRSGAYDGLRRIRRLTSDLPDVTLAPREWQVLDYAALGLTDCAIANRLMISTSTVATYWGRIRSKFGLHNRTRLVAMACLIEYEQELARVRALALADVEDLTGPSVEPCASAVPV